jgi:hypothetical protein
MVQRPDPVPISATAALVLAALLVALVQFVAGVQMVGPSHSHDGSFAVAALHYFRDGLAQGDLLPRWSMIANAGLGSPIFYFYPPLAYWVAALVASLVAPLGSGLSDAGAIAAACVIFRVGSLLTCAAWLRRHTDHSTALFGGAVYALMPYVALINPEVRLAYAETASGALLPLVFLAVDVGGGRISRTIAALAPAMAAMAFTNLPSTVIAGGLVLAYAAASSTPSANALPDAAARIAGTIAGVALGLALAGITLAPALLLIPYANYGVFNAPESQPVNHFLFTGKPLHQGSTLAADIFWHLAIIIPILIGGFGVLAARRTLKLTHRAVALTLALAVFLVTPLSRYAYLYLPMLWRIQFPFRFGLPISLLAALSLAFAMPALRPWARRLVVMCGLAMALQLAASSWLRGDPTHSYAERTQQAMEDRFHDVAEYFSAQAPMSFWDHFTVLGPQAIHQAGIDHAGCPAHHDLPIRREAGKMIITLLGCHDQVVLPQFAFPGWLAELEPGEKPAALSFDPTTGLLAATVPEGTAQLVLRRTTLPEEKRGLQISVTAVLLWLLAATLALRRPGRREAQPGTAVTPTAGETVMSRRLAGSGRPNR